MPSVQFKPDDDVYGFLAELARLFGSPKGALDAYIRSSPTFRAWRAKVAPCPHCGWYVPLRPDAVPPTLGSHWRRNPDGDSPYWVLCAGEGRPAAPWTDEPASLAVIRAHIEHRVQTLGPDLL